MPRDGSSVYTQPFPNVVSDTAIESAVYNGFTNDVAQDLNAPRPIVAGGTGATSAAGALTNLGAEKSKQGSVTNYDTFPWVNGSFFSDAGATGAPTAGIAYTGIYYEHQNTAYATIEARALSGQLYVRQKNAGVWGAWSDTDAVMDAKKVNRVGDTMSGSLTIAMQWPAIILNKDTTVNGCEIHGKRNNVTRWIMACGNQTAESGSNVGSDFQIHRYSDVGGWLGAALDISRASGNAVFGGQINANSNIVANSSVYSGVSSATVGTYYFGSNGTKYLQCDGTGFTLNGGNLLVAGLTSAGPINAPYAEIGSMSGVSTPFIDFHSSGTGNDYDARIITIGGTGAIANGSLGFEAGQFQFTGGVLYANGGVNAYGASAGSQLRLISSDNGSSKSLRTSTSGVLEFVNHAFSAVIATLSDAGGFTCNGLSAGAGNVTSNATVQGGYVTSTGNVNANSDMTAAGGFFAGPSTGYHVDTYVGGGNPWLCNALTCNPNFGSIVLQALHYTGQWAGWQFTSGSSLFQFRSDGNAAKSAGSLAWISTSDARIKDIKGEYTHGLAEIAALRPVRFTYKDNHSFMPPPETPEKNADTPAHAMTVSSIEYAGLVAQEAEMTMPELFIKGRGYIDGKAVEDLRSADYSALVFALVNAVKELKMRVEELEGR